MAVLLSHSRTWALVALVICCLAVIQAQLSDDQQAYAHRKGSARSWSSARTAAGSASASQLHKHQSAEGDAPGHAVTAEQGVQAAPPAVEPAASVALLPAAAPGSEHLQQCHADQDEHHELRSPEPPLVRHPLPVAGSSPNILLAALSLCFGWLLCKLQQLRRQQLQQLRVSVATQTPAEWRHVQDGNATTPGAVPAAHHHLSDTGGKASAVTYARSKLGVSRHLQTNGVASTMQSSRQALPDARDQSGDILPSSSSGEGGRSIIEQHAAAHHTCSTGVQSCRPQQEHMQGAAAAQHQEPCAAASTVAAILAPAGEDSHACISSASSSDASHSSPAVQGLATTRQHHHTAGMHGRKSKQRHAGSVLHSRAVANAARTAVAAPGAPLAPAHTRAGSLGAATLQDPSSSGGEHSAHSSSVHSRTRRRRASTSSAMDAPRRRHRRHNSMGPQDSVVSSSSSRLSRRRSHPHQHALVGRRGPQLQVMVAQLEGQDSVELANLVRSFVG